MNMMTPLKAEGVSEIFVDLDGTLCRGDVFIESLVRLLFRKPLLALRIFLIALSDPAGAKTLAAFHDRVAAERLPYNDGLIDYLKDQKAKGRRLTLATACHGAIARRVARHLDLFDAVLATDRRTNLKGARKLESIRRSSGAAPFCYAGDSRADAPIWSAAGTGVYVNAPGQLVRRAEAAGSAERVFVNERSTAAALLRAMRPHQWSKNLLVFVPLITSSSYTNLQAVTAAVLAFVSLSLCASGVYLLNDLTDVDSDRQHPTKRNRPIASGALSVPLAMAGVAGCMTSALLVGLAVHQPWFMASLLAYGVTTTAYSFFIKRKHTADVITLAGLYSVRIVAGAAAIAVVVSFWLLAFSMFFFLGLAYVKRYAELAEAKTKKLPGRGYGPADTEAVYILGIASSFAAVVVFALYIDSDQVTLQYRTPQILWGMCVALLYWVNRVWMLARRGEIDHDPILFALRDRVSLGCVALCGVALIAARLVQI